MHAIKQWFKQMGVYRLVMMAFALSTLIYIFTVDELEEPYRSSWSIPLSGKIIVLDPGHGGKDGGASSKSGLVEKDISLAIAKDLRDFLQEAGALVILTREEDRDLADEGAVVRKRQDLERRVQLINNSSTDLLISIHLNSIPSPKWRGAQTFYNPNRKENAIVAHLIQDELIINLNNTDRKAKMNQDIFLLRSINSIGALVEVGFLSNHEEANLLGSREYQRQVADSIYRGILRYFAGEQVPGIE